MSENANNKKKWMIVGVAVVVIAIVLVVLFSRISGDGADNKSKSFHNRRCRGE